MSDEQNLIVEKLLQKKEKKGLKISVAVISVLFLFFLGGGALAYLGADYKEKVLPGVQLGALPIGGMTKSEVKEFISDMYDKLGNEGISFKIITRSNGTKDVKILPFSKNTQKTPLVKVDADAESERLVKYGKAGNIFRAGLVVVQGRMINKHLRLNSVYVDENGVIEEIKKQIGSYESEPVNATIKIHSTNPLSYDITNSAVGIVYDYSNLSGRIIDAWSNLQTKDVIINSKEENPAVKENDLLPLTANLNNLFRDGGLTLTYDDSDTKRKNKWPITLNQISDWIVPTKKDNVFVLSLDQNAFGSYLEEKVMLAINVSPSNAKFKLNDDKTKVTEFVPSHSGVTVDKEKLSSYLNDIINERLRTGGSATTTITIPTANVDPEIKTSDSNDLGINEALGVGYSNFSGSPKNRILNIKNAVKNKLHGTLIPPDQEFSLVNTLKPFTAEAGYLPELVIVGNRIKPELAGGLCQVGTTMFRTVMNSGLPVTARTNHGLVIFYYNDPRNGNPGTDATIYEPWPDFKFKNDTGHYLLITTDMNTANGELYFTLWGTNDGRKGSYTAPKVSSWIPAGPPETIETDTLPPGKKECQGLHNGAVASFTYTREFANGEKKEEVFNSVYRAVPAMCFVGIDKTKQCDPATDPSGCVVANTIPDGTKVVVPDSVPKSVDSPIVPPLTVE